MRKMSAPEVAVPVSRPQRGALSAYFELTKPGITLMEVVSTAAGFYLALPKNPHVFLTVEYAQLFALTVVGTAFVAAGSCALNHVIEQGYDRQMKRTMQRPIPSGKLRADRAAVFGGSLVIAGVGLLAMTNLLAAALAAATAILYLAVYTPLKRKTPLATLVGGIPGALPPLGGWVAATGEITGGGILLFAILFLWQMPHFLSLAWMYRKDYERGGFPMLAVQDESGLQTGRHILVYTALLVLFTLSLTVNGITGTLFFFAALILGAGFVAVGARFLLDRSNGNARTVLLSSYFYLLAMLTLMFVDKA